MYIYIDVFTCIYMYIYVCIYFLLIEICLKSVNKS